jgi:hypothetical protein
MIRHPHFTQPIFVRFPRPPVLRGRDGVERFPPAADLPFEDAVVRQLLRVAPSIRPNQIKDLIAGREEQDVRRAVGAVRRERPEDILSLFRKRWAGAWPRGCPSGSPCRRSTRSPKSPTDPATDVSQP